MSSSPSSSSSAVPSHADPLLRRLRLRTSHGAPLTDPSSPEGNELRDAQVVGFLFGSEVDTSKFGRDLYRDVTAMCRRYPHRFKIIYVSMDPDHETYKASTTNKPWLSMVWEDGSIAQDIEEEGSGSDETADGEVFIHSLADDSAATAALTKIGKHTDVSQRPYSRIAVAEKFDVISVPHLAIYHLPSASVVASYVRPVEIRSDKLEASMAAWMEGERGPHDGRIRGVGELAYRMRWSLALAAFAICYQLLRHIGGEAYDLMYFLQKIFVPDDTPFKELQV